MKKLLLTLIIGASSGLAIAQVNVSTAGTAVTEDFNSLATTGTSSVLPAGWLILEAGTGANNTYAANDGAANSGNTYSYGTGTNSDRAFGGLASGSVQPTIGAAYVNQTGNTISSVTISFMMEQWRRGGGRTTNDSSVFSYGVNTGGLSSGTWTRYDQLDLVSAVLGGTGGAVDGNLATFQRLYSQSFNVSIANGDTLYIRWADLNSTGSDDGLAIDSFRITFNAGSGPSLVNPAANLSFVTDTTWVELSFSKASYNAASMSTLVFFKQDNSITQGTPAENPASYTPQSNFSLTSSVYAHDAAAKCVMNSDADSVVITGLTPGKTYHALVYVVRDADSAYSAAATQSTTTIDTAAPPPPPPAPEYPLYTIGQINTVNGVTGVPDSNGVKVMLRGVVIGFNQRTTGIQFVLKDATGGTTLFNSAKNFGYTTVTEGDSIYVKGVVTTFRGLHEVNIDTLWQGSTVAGTISPVTVTALNEGTENNLVRLNGVRFMTPPAGSSWPVSSTNFSIITQANDTFTLRLLATSALAGQALPSTPTFDVTGIGAQFSTSSTAPFAFNGYQIYPRKTADIAEVVVPAVPQPVAISTINKTNMVTGVPDSLNASVYIKGVAVGFNQRTSGLLFVIDDGTGGITLFNSTKTFGYTVLEGDSVYAKGTIGTFRGLTQVILDTLWKVNGTASLPAPMGVTVLNETTENKLVKLGRVRFVTPPSGTTWATASTNYPVITQQNDTFTVRVLATSALAGQPLPVNPEFDVTGLGAQFSSSTAAPFAFNGYQIFPRRSSDITDVIIPAVPQPVAISTINKTNMTSGLPDSLGASVYVRGVALGFNQRTAGLLFVIDDGTGGISVFNSSKNFGYTVQQGDSVYAKGVVATFRGLTQITLDTLWQVPGSTNIYAPASVTALTEARENKLVKLSGVRFVTAPGGPNWSASNTSYSIITAQSDTVTLRLLGTSGLANTPLPATPTFDVTGLVGQFSSSSVPPFSFDGYQIIPRNPSDINEIPVAVSDSIAPFNLLAPANNTVISIDSPLTSTYVFSWAKPDVFGNVDSITYYFEVDSIGGDFGEPYVSIPTSGDINDTTLVLTEEEVKTMVENLGMVPGEVFYGKWRVYAEYPGNFSVSALSVQSFNLTVDFVLNNGVDNFAFDRALRVYPNPTAGVLRISHEKALQGAEIYDLAGKKLAELDLKGLTISEINVKDLGLNSGLYTLKIKGLDGETALRKLVVQ